VVNCAVSTSATRRPVRDVWADALAVPLRGQVCRQPSDQIDVTGEDRGDPRAGKVVSGHQ
jgi:hypothetical protein